MRINSAMSTTFTEGFYFPFDGITNKKGMGLDVATTLNLLSWNVGDIKYDENNYVTETGLSYQAMIPIALCYKSGGENTLRKCHKDLFTAGVGVAPTMAITKVVDVDGGFYVRKFVFVEFGYYAGIAFKLRVNAFLDKMTLVNIQGTDLASTSADKIVSNSYGVVDTKVIGKPGINVSLLLMPYSFQWKKCKKFGDVTSKL